jgi:Protein of unknown function (DUF3253)
MGFKHDSHVLPDSALRSGILQSLKSRDRGKSICPSEIARALSDDKDWHRLMPRIRKALIHLLREQRVIVTRGTTVLRVDEMRGGPTRIRRGPQFDGD